MSLRELCDPAGSIKKSHSIIINLMIKHKFIVYIHLKHLNTLIAS